MTAANAAVEETQRMVEALESTGRFMVLQRFTPVDKFQSFQNEEARSRSKLAMVFACKTTGRNAESDRLVRLSYVMVRFSSETGVIYEVDSAYSGLEDPGAPISQRMERVIGISDAELSGKSFDTARINEDISRAVVFISHNAEVDRRFLEGRFETVSDKWFISSQREAPWEKFGVASRNLEFLAFAVAGFFLREASHLMEVEALVQVLARKTPGGEHVLKEMLDASREPTWRIWASASQTEQKRTLFERGYRMTESVTQDKQPIKGWSRVVRSLENEMAFLGARVYLEPVKITVEEISGKERYSDKAGRSEQVLITLPSSKGEDTSKAEEEATDQGARSQTQQLRTLSTADRKTTQSQKPAPAGDFPI